MQVVMGIDVLIPARCDMDIMLSLSVSEVPPYKTNESIYSGHAVFFFIIAATISVAYNIFVNKGTNHTRGICCANRIARARKSGIEYRTPNGECSSYNILFSLSELHVIYHPLFFFI
jgi:hypothetical protein